MRTTASHPAARIPPLHRWLHAARKQLPLLRTLTLSLYLPLTLLFAALCLQRAVPVTVLLRDANSMAATGLFYQGALSHLGVLLWWAAAVVSAFTYVVLRRAPRQPERVGGSRAFFLYLSVFTAVLTLDDMFMLHEEALPNYVGVPEEAVYLSYGVLALGFVRFLPVIFRTPFLLLALALGFFAFSVLTDYGMLRFLFELPEGAGLVIEDLSKALGIVSWLGYTVHTAHKQVTCHLQVPLETPATVLGRIRPPSAKMSPLKPMEKVS